IPKVSFELEQCMRSFGFSDEQVLDIQLAVEEAITNSIVHGYAGGTGTLGIRCRAGPEEVTVEISDNAPPFDPLDVPDPDISADIREREIGGLGVFLIKKVTDRATYRYENAQNILTLVKKKNR
ncbi:MAG: ATP-binding protein, partial [Methanoregula sp.]|nr:ATP-binding protein [Methanoregula sp.]